MQVSDYYASRIPDESEWVDAVKQLDLALNDNMRFMTTMLGRVGWAHPRSRKGDEICLLEGCSVPVILRARAEGDFVLVGDAYVEAVMDGELVEDREVEWTDIKIH